MRLIEANPELESLVRQLNKVLPVFKQPLVLKRLMFTKMTGNCLTIA